MKNNMFYQLLSLFLIVVLVYVYWNQSKNETNTGSKEDIVISNILERKSVRSFTDEKISDEDLLTLVKTGMAAPSGVNIQPWYFVVINQQEVMKEISGLHRAVGMAEKAPAAIVVCGDMDAYKGKEQFEGFWSQDTSASTQNILLAAEAMGLGAVWTGVFPDMVKVENLQEMLNLPKNLVPLNIIVLGHPKGVTTPKNKWDEKKLHWNKL